MKKLLPAMMLGWFAGLALAQATDPTAALIERQTNLTSDAEQRGDQKTVDALTADEILFSAGDGAVQRDSKFDKSDALSRELRAKTMALHGQTSVAEHLPDKTLFIDENGSLNAASDFAAGPATLSDWVLHRRDDVAISSFTLSRNDKKFLAVEIWQRRRAGWQLAGGQTIPLYNDPPLVHLSAKELEQFAGTYSAGPGSSLTLAVVADDDLSVSQTGSTLRHLRPMGENEFFTAGLPAGYQRAPSTFERDKTGRVEKFVRSGVVFQKIEASDAISGAAPSAGSLKLRDFKVLHVGDLAIAAFFHDRDSDYYGQTVHQTFRSMESWINEKGTWKMISSQGRQI